MCVFACLRVCLSMLFLHACTVVIVCGSCESLPVSLTLPGFEVWIQDAAVSVVKGWRRGVFAVGCCASRLLCPRAGALGSGRGYPNRDFSPRITELGRGGG